MSLPARQREALQAMPLVSDKATASMMNVSPSHLCGTLTALLGRGYIVSEPTRSPYGRIVRRWILTSKGEMAVARLKRKSQPGRIGDEQRRPS